jgi:predicted RNA-binding Zn-ribbon protein involved in translation (DUF1610 family)
MTQWYCRVSGIREGAAKEFGPISSATLRQWVSEQRLSPTDMVKEEGGTWFVANKLQGITWPTTAEPARTSAASIPPPPDSCNVDYVQADAIEDRFKNCPHCGEQILAAALKCKHCHEMLTPASRGVSSTIADAQQTVKKAIADAQQRAKKTSPMFVLLTIFLSLCGCAASLLCLVAGLYLLSIRSQASLQGEGTIFEAIGHGVGIYCIGKAFFVGPLLFAAAANMLARTRD